MKKPIFRWTIGNVGQNIGYECLEYSIKSVLKLYEDTFEYYIFYNNSNVQILREIVGSKPISLIKQDWSFCPIPLDINKNKFTALWKVCPARLDINNHEIIIDNDIIMLKKSIEIEEFLSSNKVMITEDPIKYQGKFSHLFTDKNYNSGFMGLPPGYDFAKDIREIWKNNNAPQSIDNGDEQGLTTAALCLHDHIFISKEKFMLVHTDGKTKETFYDESKNQSQNTFEKITNFFSKSFCTNIDAYHFVGANRTKFHNHWDSFKKQYNSFNNKIKLL